MAALRAILIVAALIGFFLVGAPIQWLIARWAPAAAHVVPLVFCRCLLRLLAVRVVVSGERAKGAPVLIASNHISWIDILAYGGITPFCFLAKSEVGRWPIVSAFAEVQGTVFVDRQRRRSIPQANRSLAARMIEGRTALLFPEATTLAGPLPGRFYSPHFGAVQDVARLSPDAPATFVQPAAIAYSSGAAAWIDDDNLLEHVWHTLRAPPLTCHIAFGAPIVCDATTDRKALTRLARDAVAALLEPRVAGVEAAYPTSGLQPAATG